MGQEQDNKGHGDDNVLLVAGKVTHFLKMRRCRVEENEGTSATHGHLIQLHPLKVWVELGLLTSIEFI